MKKCTALLGAVELAAGGDFEAGMAALGDSSSDEAPKADGGAAPQRAPGTPEPPAPPTADALAANIFADEFFVDED